MSFDFDQDSYKALRRVVAERTSSLVAWVGAGLSVPAGLPTWPGLIDHLVDVSRRKLATMSGATREHGLFTALTQHVRDKDYWVAFQLAEELLGQISYESEIRIKLDISTQPPPAYLALWRTGLQGMISLNLDHFALQSYSSFRPGTNISKFVGAQAKNMAGVLQRSTLFVGNPHGIIDDSSTWIFTQTKLQKLLKDPGYQQFLNACLLSRTIVFVGVTADDTAIETHLKAIKNAKIRGVTHFWITDRTDADTDRWGEDLNLRIIRYEAKGHDHSPLVECLNDLAHAAPSIDPKYEEPIIFSGATRAPAIPSLENLLTQPLEDIRAKLNGYALEIFANPDEQAYEHFSEFEEKYDEAIDRAWYVGTKPPKNMILGYQLNNRVKVGSFGDVYDATSPTGERVAVKLLRRDVRREPAMLQTFRRGVRSMKILKSHSVPGMVNFIDASEIPALVVMEWIEGPNLMEAVNTRSLAGWNDILVVARDLARIVHSAHLLPERVLHRDIRPPNVMLRNFRANDPPEVVVMDFDLSWHKDALEKSIVAKPLGFMAPEQLHGRDTTRSALVDSFGFGMTLFYMLTTDIPVPDQQKHKDWERVLTLKIRNKRCQDWRSIPTRVMRLVQSCTLDKQSERPDFSKITAELDSLVKALNGEASEISADYYGEEVAAYAETMNGYNWDVDGNLALYVSGGLSIELSADIPNDELQLSMKWQQTGEENWKLWPKTNAQVGQKASPHLEKHGWGRPKFIAAYGQMVVSAVHTLDRQNFDPKTLGRAIDSVVAAMTPKN